MVIFSDKFSPSRQAAIQAYQMFVPGYRQDTLKSDGARYHSFTIGRVLFIVTDTSSERDASLKTTLGLEQKQWMKAKLQTAAANSPNILAIIWAR